MITKRNPKQEGSVMFDCRPQTGTCPNNCFQCFYNRRGAFYNDINQPNVPTPDEVGDGIVRMNCGHDSNIQRELVIETAAQYKYAFFNTSIPNFDFPGPVVFTANPKEEEFPQNPKAMDWPDKTKEFNNLMFIRLRVSPTNLDFIEKGIKLWNKYQIPIVLTFMAYYDGIPPGTTLAKLSDDPLGFKLKNQPKGVKTFTDIAYRWQKRHINSYFCATEAFMRYVTKMMKEIGGKLVTRCGSSEGRYCRDCHNCETFYYQTRKHLEEL